MPKSNELGDKLLSFATYAVAVASEEELEETKKCLQECIDDEYYHGQIDDIIKYAIQWLSEDHYQTK